MLNDVCYLVSKTNLQNDEGYNTPVKLDRREVFCEVSKPTRAEFYQALTAGVLAELVVTVNKDDYDGEQLVEYADVLYKVIRTYDTAGLLVEMTLKQDAGEDGEF